MREIGLNWTEFSISLVADSVYPTKLFGSEILFSILRRLWPGGDA